MSKVNLVKDLKVFVWPWLDFMVLFRICLTFFSIICCIWIYRVAWESIKKVQYESVLEEHKQLAKKVSFYKESYEKINCEPEDFVLANTNFMSNCLNFLAKTVPSGVWLTSFDLLEGGASKSSILLAGKAYQYSDVAEFLRLYDESELMEKRNLISMKEERGKDGFINFVFSTKENLFSNQ